MKNAYNQESILPPMTQEGYHSIYHRHPLEISLFEKSLTSQERLRYFGDPKKNP